MPKSKHRNPAPAAHPISGLSSVSDNEAKDQLYQAGGEEVREKVQLD